ncbi:MAG: ferredoxin--NADP reductase [Nevskiaceae bacterium]
MSSYEVALKHREPVARDTVTLKFEKPAGFAFKAGQSLDLTLINPARTDAKGPKRALSIVSAPYEEHLQVATRVRDSVFKQALRDMPVGTRVQVEGPFGSMTLHGNRSRRGIFVAGGIGITPFMSMLRQAAHDDLPHSLSLIYSNRRPEDAPFLAELEELARRRRGTFQLVTTMTGAADPAWHGRVGTINAGLIESVRVPPAMPIFYVAGPPALVAAMRAVLNGMGVEDDDIRSEDFAGY